MGKDIPVQRKIQSQRFFREKRSYDSPPAIVLGCHKLGLGVIRALGVEGIPVVGVYYHERDMGYVSKFVISAHRCPHPDHDEDGFISLLVDLASQLSGSVLVPCDDGTLTAVSRHKPMLERFYKVMANDWSVTEKTLVKKHTYAIADNIGIPSPKTMVAHDLQEAKAFVNEIGFPCLLKPTVGHKFFEVFRKKMIMEHNLNNFENTYRKMEEAGVEMMIQEFIPGGDKCGVNYNSFFVNGEAKVEVTAEKVRLSPPFLGFPRVVISKSIPEVLGPGRNILGALKYDGFSCMEFKKDSRNGVYKLMEINSRLNFSTPLSVMSGVNFPCLSYKYALSGELPESDLKFDEGIYWIDIGKDIAESIKSYRTENLSLREYLRPYFSPHVFTILSLHDPRPMLKRFFDGVKFMPRYLMTTLGWVKTPGGHD